MLFANDHHDNRIYIDDTCSNQEYYCPYCGTSLVIKKGERRQHHFAHKPNHICKDSWEREHLYDISPWHMNWQLCYPKENQEIRLSLDQIAHRADVIVDRTVIEFQNSVLSASAFDDRNNFYFNFGYKVIWLFNLTDLIQNGLLTYQKNNDCLIFHWKNPKKSFNSYDVKSGCIDLFLQLDDGESNSIVRVLDVSEKGFEEFTASHLMRREDFLTYTGLTNGYCRPPFLDTVESEEQYIQFKNQYGIALNRQQERAMLSVEGATLVLAVPGSGKTTVLVSRLGYMVLYKKILPENILAITYTKNAAREMEDRYKSQFEIVGATGITFCTINSLADSIYGMYCSRSGRKKNRLLENNKELIGRIFKEITGEIAEEHEKESLATAISYAKNMCYSGAELEQMKPCSNIANFKEFFIAYQNALRTNSLMDYDDQLIFAYKLLQNDQFAKYYQERYRYICVDEAQDTSLIQYKILQILAKGNHIFMVGDEDQSIYGFRAAYPKGLLNFRYDYLNPYILRMEKNYRSTGNIVKKAHCFISKNTGRYEKSMFTDREPGAEVSIENVRDRNEQYDRIVKIATEATAETAFLYRNNESAVVLMDRLLRNNIPFRFQKAKLDFFNASVIKDVVAFLKISLDAHDYGSLDRVWGKGVLQYLGSKRKYYALKACQSKQISVFEAVDEQMNYVAGYNKYRGDAFHTLMVRMSKTNTYDAICMLMKEEYGNYLEEKHLDTGKIDILKMLAKEEPDISKFLDRLQYLADKMKENYSIRNGNEIILSTIHSSKGLEYDTVYIVDLYDGCFPAARGEYHTHTKDSACAEQEERRLLYVGMTRAKNRLCFFKQEDSTSQYLNELFQKLICKNCGVEDTIENFYKYIGIENGIPVGICNECTGDL